MCSYKLGPANSITAFLHPLLILSSTNCRQALTSSQYVVSHEKRWDLFFPKWFWRFIWTRWSLKTSRKPEFSWSLAYLHRLGEIPRANLLETSLSELVSAIAKRIELYPEATSPRRQHCYQDQSKFPDTTRSDNIVRIKHVGFPTQSLEPRSKSWW